MTSVVKRTWTPILLLILLGIASLHSPVSGQPVSINAPPALQPGYYWVYDVTDKTGRFPPIYQIGVTVTTVQAYQNTSVFVITVNASDRNTALYAYTAWLRTNDWATLQVVDHPTPTATIILIYQPARRLFTWPLTPESTWEDAPTVHQTIISESQANNSSQIEYAAFHVSNQTTVRVKAGEFTAYVIDMVKEDTVVSRTYFSPTAKSPYGVRWENEGATVTWELTAYRLDQELPGSTPSEAAIPLRELLLLLAGGAGLAAGIVFWVSRRARKSSLPEPTEPLSD